VGAAVWEKFNRFNGFRNATRNPALPGKNLIIGVEAVSSLWSQRFCISFNPATSNATKKESVNEIPAFELGRRLDPPHSGSYRWGADVYKLKTRNQFSVYRFGEAMIRVFAFCVAVALIAALASLLIYFGWFTGGQSHSAQFSFGGVNVEYEVNAPGRLRPDRLEYVILSEGDCQAETIHFSNGVPSTITRVCLDEGKTNRVSFSTKPGQTVWISKDRSVHIASVPIQLNEIKFMEQHSGEDLKQNVSSLENLKATLARMGAKRVAQGDATSLSR
jgi:hypothetical protein